MSNYQIDSRKLKHLDNLIFGRPLILEIFEVSGLHAAHGERRQYGHAQHDSVQMTLRSLCATEQRQVFPATRID